MAERQARPDEADIGVLVVSWDGYEDIWGEFFRSFFAQWPECPFPVYLGSNHCTFVDDRVEPILVGREVDYCTNLAWMLERLPHKWVLVWVDDFIPTAPVDTERVLTIVRYVEEARVEFANLAVLSHEVSPLFAGPAVVDSLGEMPEDVPYRAALGVGLWSREALLGLIVRGESAWEFERNGSRRSSDLGFRCICSRASGSSSPPIAVVNAIKQGEWTREAARFLQREGRGAALRSRGVEGKVVGWVAHVRSLVRYHLLRLVCAVGGGAARRLVRRIVERGRFARGN